MILLSFIRASILLALLMVQGCSNTQPTHKLSEYKKGDFEVILGTETYKVDPYITLLSINECLMLKPKATHRIPANVYSEHPLITPSIIAALRKQAPKKNIISRARGEYQNQSNSYLSAFNEAFVSFTAREIHSGVDFKKNNSDTQEISLGHGKTTENYIYEISTSIPAIHAKKYYMNEVDIVQLRFKVASYSINWGVQIAETRLGHFTTSSNVLDTKKIAADLLGIIAADRYSNQSCLEEVIRKGWTKKNSLIETNDLAYPLSEEPKFGGLCLRKQFNNLKESLNIEVFAFNHELDERLLKNRCTLKTTSLLISRLKKLSGKELCFPVFDASDQKRITTFKRAFYKQFNRPLTHWLVTVTGENETPLGCSTYTSDELYNRIN